MQTHNECNSSELCVATKASSFFTLASLWRKSLLSTAIFIIVSGTLLSILAARYPVSRELGLGTIEHVEYDWEVDLAVKNSDVSEVVKAIYPGRIYSFSMMQTNIVEPKNEKEVWASNFYLTTTPETADLSQLPDTMRISGSRDETSGAWIDLSYELANSLEVKSGDKVLVNLGLPDDSMTEYIVRGIYAVKDPTAGGVAVASFADPLKYSESHLSESDYAFISGISDDEILKSLNKPNLTEILVTDWGVSPDERISSSQTESEEYLSEYVKPSPGTALTVPIIAGVVLLLILIREGAKARRETAPWTVTLTRIGVPVRRAANIFRLLHVLTVTTATLTASALAYAIYTSGKLGLVIPPMFHTTWLITTAGATLTAALISALFLSTTRRLKAGKS